MVSLSKLDSISHYHRLRDLIYRHSLFNKLVSYRLLGLFVLHDFLVIIYNLYYYKIYNFNTLMLSLIDLISTMPYSLLLICRIYMNVTSEKLNYSFFTIFNKVILLANLFFIGYYSKQIYSFYMLPLTIVWISLIIKLSIPFMLYIIINFMIYKIFDNKMTNNEKIIFYNMSFYNEVYKNKSFFNILWYYKYHIIPNVSEYNINHINKKCRLCSIKYIKYDLILTFPCGHSAHTACLPDEPYKIKEFDDCILVI